MLTFRPAKPSDVEIMHGLIHELAKHEQREHLFVNTPDKITQSFFVEQHAQAIIVQNDHSVVGLMIFYPMYSSFQGRPYVYLEDIVISEKHRKNGYGKQCMAFMAEYCEKHGYFQLMWSCLKTNQSSIDFYKQLGAGLDDGILKFTLKVGD